MIALKNITKKAKVYSLLSHTDIHGGTDNTELCNNVYILFGLVKEKKKINYFLQARNPTTNPKFSLVFSSLIQRRQTHLFDWQHYLINIYGSLRLHNKRKRKTNEHMNGQMTIYVEPKDKTYRDSLRLPALPIKENRFLLIFPPFPGLFHRVSCKRHL